jgi:hypothetical protein
VKERTTAAGLGTVSRAIRDLIFAALIHAARARLASARTDLRNLLSACPSEHRSAGAGLGLPSAYWTRDTRDIGASYREAAPKTFAAGFDVW